MGPCHLDGVVYPTTLGQADVGRVLAAADKLHAKWIVEALAGSGLYEDVGRSALFHEGRGGDHDLARLREQRDGQPHRLARAQPAVRVGDVADDKSGLPVTVRDGGNA